MSRVRHADFDERPFVSICTQLEAALAHREIRHRIHSVHDQIQEELLEPDTVASDRRKVRREIGLELDSATAAFGPGQAQHIRGQLVYIHLSHLHLSRPYKRTNISNDIARAKCVTPNVGHNLPDL